MFLRAEEFLEPVIADDFVARHLEVPEGAPVFLVERHSFFFFFFFFVVVVGDKPGEFRQATMRGGRYRHRYRIDLR